MRRSVLRILLWYAVGMAILGVGASAAGVLRLGEVAAALARIRVSGLLWLAGVNALILLAAAGRWRLLLAGFGPRAGWVRLTRYRLAAGAVSYVTPGTQFGGEPLQAFLLVKREGVPADVAAASVLLERAMELGLNLLLVGGGLLWLAWRPFPGLAPGFSRDAFDRLGPGGAGWGLAAVCGGAAFLAAWRIRRRRKGASSGGGSPAGRLSRVGRLIRSTLDRARELLREKPGALLSAMGFGLVHWGLVFGEFYLLYRCVGWRLSAPQVFVVLAAARIGLWAPVPGGMGALEAGQVMAAGLLGLPPAAAVGVCLLIRLRDLLVCTAGLVLTGRYLSRAIEGNRNGILETGI